MASTPRHCCDIFSKEAQMPGRNDAEIGPSNSLQASKKVHMEEHHILSTDFAGRIRAIK